MSGDPDLDLAARPRRASGLDALHLDGQELLFDGTELRLLAGPAAQIWTRVDGLSSVAAIAADVAVETGHPQPELVRADVRRFLADLVEQGLLELGSTATSYVRPPHVGYVADGAVTLLVDLPSGRRRGLTSNGSRIWQLVCSGTSLPDLVAILRGEFPDAPDTLESEVVGLLDELVEAGFLAAGLREPDAVTALPD